MKKKIGTLIILTCLFISGFGQTSSTVNTRKDERVGAALGFLIGQEKSLALIKKQVPARAIQVQQSQQKFNSAFGKAKNRMINYLIESYGNEKYIEFEQTINKKLDEMASAIEFDQESANQFLSEVEARASGQIPSPTLETLLSFQFFDIPKDEFLRGFTNTYKVTGHPKAKNTDWQIRVPKSWRSEEADRPNIIQKFVSDYGRGNELIMLMVMDMPKEVKPTKENLEGLFTMDGMNILFPGVGANRKFTKMTIDGVPGGLFEYEQIAERLDYKFNTKMYQFMFVHQYKMYIIQGMVMIQDENGKLTASPERFLPLFKLVVNSAVINSQYSK